MQELDFDFDQSEAVAGDEFLTPVYFRRYVLIRYLYDPRFHCDFASDTYGQIAGEGFRMAFGLNQFGSVIAWLGDLLALPVSERQYWRIENQPSEHDARSEFFQAQVGAVFTQPPAAIRCLNVVAELNATFHRRFGVHLYHERTLEARLQDVRRYKRLVIGNKDDFKRFLSELNEIVNENADHSAARQLLKARSIAVPDNARGNKLLEAIYTGVLDDKGNAIAPFYYLYDLRLWANHAIGDERRNEIAAALGVSDPDDFEAVMDALLRRMEASARSLIQKVEAV